MCITTFTVFTVILFGIFFMLILVIEDCALNIVFPDNPPCQPVKVPIVLRWLLFGIAWLYTLGLSG
jgi:hypothetical protein